MAKKAAENPKTTILGIIALIASIGSVWAPAKYQPQIQATAAAVASLGLVGAKDHDK